MSKSMGVVFGRIWEKVQDHTGWDNNKVRLWFRTKNPILGDISPDEFIDKRPEKAERVIDSMLAGDGP